MNENTIKRANRILEIARNMAKSLGYKVVNRIEEIQLHYEGYREPGYNQSNLIATGNWNSITNYGNGCHTMISDLPKRMADMFDKMGIECEWSDEWTEC